MGIEPTSSAWKAEVIAIIRHPLDNTGSVTAGYPPFQSLNTYGGGGRIRTSEAEAADLQSAPFDRSGTPPKLEAAYFA